MQTWSTMIPFAARSSAPSSTLTERQRDVIMLYFGIGIEHPMSLEDIGEKFSLTRERVRQIKDKSITKLRTASRCDVLKTYLGN